MPILWRTHSQDRSASDVKASYHSQDWVNKLPKVKHVRGLTILKFQVTSEVHGRPKVKSQVQVLAYAMAGDLVVVKAGPIGK